ncbi:MAG TPA: ABC transporter ATP-binding protein [Tepidisphaeraceae bacterium]
MVELRQITKRFGDFLAVDRVDLKIEPGEFLTLLGPSGCGKTTLLRTISGFETPTDGIVLLDGRDVTPLPPYRRDVNQVFQSYALFPHLNVRQNIAFGLKMKRVPRVEREQRVREAIELVALAGFEARRPSQLSGGQKQRVALARALICRPRVLLLDEPLAALDAKLRRAMQVELKRLQARVGITFVFVTHDQEEALVMSDRIAVMNRGRIEQLGRAMDVYHKPATAFVADFLGQANVLPARLISQDDQWADLLAGDALRLRVPRAALPPGGAVGYVSIRPERITLNHGTVAGGATHNAFPATIRERIFRGPTEQLILHTDFAPQITTLSSNNGTGPMRSASDKVVCTIDPEDMVVLPPAGEMPAP